MHGIVVGVVAWFALAGTYLLFAGEVSTVEVSAAIACATLGAALVGATQAFGTRQFRLRPPARALLRPLASILPDFVAVGRELVATVIHGGGRLRGDFLYQPFENGGDDPRSCGRRAIAIIGLSLAPRTFVVRESDDALLLHALPRKPPSDNTTWPA